MSLPHLYNQFLHRTQRFLSKTMGKLSSLMKLGTESPLRIRRRQIFVGVSLALGLTALVYGLLSVFVDRGPQNKKEAAPKPVTTSIATATKQVDMDEVRWYALDKAIKSLGQEIAALRRETDGRDLSHEGTVVDLPRSPKDSSENQDEDTDTESTRAENALNDPRFQEIQERLAFLESEREAHLQQPLNVPNAQALQEGNTQEGRVIHKLSLNLTHNEKARKTVETTIPAGAFAKTVLLSGLDASSAMSASSDPRPMLLRMIDHGTLPRRFQSDLKDCHCTAGAYGDLSSERVYARLEKLTCIDRLTGEIIELQVSGYVSGSDGKAGIRGVVASKDGQFLARSLMGGIFAGLSNVANPQNRRAQVNPFFGGGTASSETSGPSIGENFLSGMSSGATSALDRLSQYYIDRAEQLQPVIQIAAGQVVDIVFTGGAERSSAPQSSVISNQKEKGE